MKLACLCVCVLGALVGSVHAGPVAKVPAQPVIDPAVAARIPEAGWLVAGATMERDGVFAIARITRTGLVELTRETGTFVTALHWVDRTTLLVVDGDDARARLRWFVEGKLDASRTVEVTAADWPAPAGTRVDLTDVMVATTPGGGLWLHECVQRAADGERCKRTAYLRVDARPFTATTRKPKQLRDVEHQIMAARGPGDTALPRLGRAPSGYKVALKKITFTDDDLGTMTVKGFECTGAGTSTRWPLPDVSDVQFELRPDKVQWLTATPPLFFVEGKQTNPIGDTSRSRAYFRACDRAALDDFRWYGGGLWADHHSIDDGSDVVDEYWTVHLDQHDLAIVTGSTSWFTLAPR